MQVKNPSDRLMLLERMGRNGRLSAGEIVIVRGASFHEDIAQSISPRLWPGLSTEVNVCADDTFGVCFPPQCCQPAALISTSA